ncbi:MDR family MFS transporter [Rhodococcus sp. X156]|uniref:MDR family MFS transporter n=1 Tax=Rhodococcus sp. X156 TaxID=2499145 RepID=UPI001F4A013E|nr:MDR family MFS transporter [Rhodococcus sp. X156]
MEALSGLLLAMFVTALASTVVANALPTIIPDLHGSDAAYSWVVTSTLLAMTVSTPLWGKLADLFSKKLLMQLALVIFTIASVAAGMSASTGMLLTCRAFQGVGAGGVAALTQVVLAAMVSPRERGRYSGYLGGTYALATVSGPLIGGVLVDTSWLGWRWCFYVVIPFAVAGIVVLQRTLVLPVQRRPVRIDYLGALLISAGVSALLIWVSLAGKRFAWASPTTAVLVSGGVLLLAIAVVVETRVAEPLLPLNRLRGRTVVLATVASTLVGVVMFACTVFLSQYFQVSQGVSPTKAGMLTLPFIGGMFVASTVVGRLVSAFGYWKRYLVLGAVLLVAGLAAMATVREDTSYLVLALAMCSLGTAMGLLMQNLILAVQNTVDMRDIGAASSGVMFFRTLGGAAGVSALGALLATRAAHHARGTGALQPGGGGALPDVAALPEATRAVVQSAYGHGTGDLFLVATPLGILTLICILLIREVPLRKTVDASPTGPTADAPAAGAAPTAAAPPALGAPPGTLSGA